MNVNKKEVELELEQLVAFARQVREEIASGELPDKDTYLTFVDFVPKSMRATNHTVLCDNGRMVLRLRGHEDVVVTLSDLKADAYYGVSYLVQPPNRLEDFPLARQFATQSLNALVDYATWRLQRHQASKPHNEGFNNELLAIAEITRVLGQVAPNIQVVPGNIFDDDHAKVDFRYVVPASDGTPKLSIGIQYVNTSGRKQYHRIRGIKTDSFIKEISKESGRDKSDIRQILAQCSNTISEAETQTKYFSLNLPDFLKKVTGDSENMYKKLKNIFPDDIFCIVRTCISEEEIVRYNDWLKEGSLPRGLINKMSETQRQSFIGLLSAPLGDKIVKAGRECVLRY